MPDIVYYIRHHLRRATEGQKTILSTHSQTHQHPAGRDKREQAETKDDLDNLSVTQLIHDISLSLSHTRTHTHEEDSSFVGTTCICCYLGKWNKSMVSSTQSL